MSGSSAESSEISLGMKMLIFFVGFGLASVLGTYFGLWATGYFRDEKRKERYYQKRKERLHQDQN